MKANSKQIEATAIMAIMAALTLPPSPARAQDMSQNYVKTVTMLKAGGTDSVQAVQYYNGLGWPTVSVATADAAGGTACALTTYDALGRELRKYAPVPGSGLDYMAESAVISAGYGFHHDNGGLTLRNGRVDKLQFEEGYCQASAYSGNPSQDDITFYYYDRDHLGNIRQGESY